MGKVCVRASKKEGVGWLGGRGTLYSRVVGKVCVRASKKEGVGWLGGRGTLYSRVVGKVCVKASKGEGKEEGVVSVPCMSE